MYHKDRCHGFTYHRLFFSFALAAMAAMATIGSNVQTLQQPLLDSQQDSGGPATRAVVHF
jgi:hypothetical protein